LSHWRSVMQSHQGDRILHYANGFVRALGTATDEPQRAARPDALADGPWSNEGFCLRVSYHELEAPIGLADIAQEWRVYQGAPFTKAGGVRQGYFYPLSETFVQRLAGRFPQLGLGTRMLHDEHLSADVIRARAARRG